MNRMVLAFALVCCLATSTWAQIDKYCTVRFEGAISVRTQSKDYGTISVAIKPTVLFAEAGPYGPQYSGGVELYYRSLDPDILIHDQLGPNCTFAGVTGKMAEGRIEIYVDTTKTPKYYGMRLLFADSPKEVLTKRCGDATDTDSLHYWVTRYRAAYGLDGNTFYYDDFTQQTSGARKVDHQQIRTTDSNGIWTTDVTTTIEITDGSTPQMHVGWAGMKWPLIPGVPTLTDWSGSLVFGNDTMEAVSVEMTINGERYPMNKRNGRSFDYYEVDLVGHTTWQDTAVPVFFRTVLNDGTILEDTVWQPLMKRPDWLVEGTGFKVSGTSSDGGPLRYSFTNGVRSGRLNIALREPTISFYAGPGIHPVFNVPMGFMSYVDAGTASGAFYLWEQWNSGRDYWIIPSVVGDSVIVPFQLQERFDFHFGIIPMFSVVGRDLRMAYSFERSGTTSATWRSLGRMDALYGSMMNSMEEIAAPEEIARVAGTTLATRYRAGLGLANSQLMRIGNDELVPTGPLWASVSLDISTSQSIDVNEYLAIHATTEADLKWNVSMTPDSITEKSLTHGGLSEQILLADVLGNVFRLTSRFDPARLVPTPVVQRPSSHEVPPVLMNETNERNYMDSRQRHGARPAIAVNADGVRAAVWSARHEYNTGIPVVAVAARTPDMTSSAKLMHIGSSQPFIHRPAVAFDNQNRMIVAWESAREVPRSSKSGDVAEFLPTIKLRWAVIDMKRWKAVDSGQVDVAPGRGIQLHTATDGTVHAFWKSTYNAATASASIKHSTWNGQKWSAPEVVMFDVVGMGPWNSAVRNDDRMIVALTADGHGYSAAPGADRWSIQDHGPAENILPLLTSDGRRQVVIRVDSALVIADHDELTSRTQYGRDDMGLAFSRAKARMDGTALLLAGVRNDGPVVIRHDGVRTTVLSEPTFWSESLAGYDYVRWGAVLWLDDGTVDYSLATVFRNSYYEDDDTRILIGRFPLNVVTSSEDMPRQRSGAGSYVVHPGHRLTFVASAGTYEWYDVMGRKVYRMDVVDGTSPVCPELAVGTYVVTGPGYRGAVLVR